MRINNLCTKGLRDGEAVRISFLRSLFYRMPLFPPPQTFWSQLIQTVQQNRVIRLQDVFFRQSIYLLILWPRYIIQPLNLFHKNDPVSWWYNDDFIGCPLLIMILRLLRTSWSPRTGGCACCTTRTSTEILNSRRRRSNCSILFIGPTKVNQPGDPIKPSKKKKKQFIDCISGLYCQKRQH